MKKKKSIVLVLVMLLMLSALAGCGDSSDTGSGSETDSAASAESTETEEEDSGSEESAEITFESLTVVDNDECSIVITGIDENSIWGYTLEAELENKSSDKTYMFAVEDASVNGIMCDPYFATTVAAGKKSLESIDFSDDTLEEYGVETITDIEIKFHVYEEDDWSGNYVAEETVHVYPYGEEAAALYERGELETDTVLIDNDDVTVIITGYEMDSIWGYTANVYVVNKTDTEVMFSADDVSVNGYMCDPLWAVSIWAGKCGFSTISWDESSLEEIGITDPETEIETIELLLNAYDETYTVNYADEIVTLNP